MPRFGVWKQSLDIVTSLALLTAASIFISGTLARRGDASPRPPTLTPPKEPQTLDGAHVLGDPKAQVVVVGYSDFLCRFCADFARDTLPRIDAHYIKRGLVQFAFRHHPIERIHPLAMRAAIAADCAGTLGRFWLVHDLLYANQRSLSDAIFPDLLVSAGVDRDTARQCLETGPDKIRLGVAAGTALGITGTPAFFVGRLTASNSVAVMTAIRGARPYQDFADAIDQALRGSR